MNESTHASSAMDVEETPCRLKSNQRRSTFLRRRSTLPPQDIDGRLKDACNQENADNTLADRIENVGSENTENNQTQEVQFDLGKYIEVLKQERKTWKQTLADRKRQHKTVLKQAASLQPSEQDLDLNILSESERTFLLMQPNYELIFEKAKKLSVMAVETGIMNEHVMHLHNRCILRMDKKLKHLTTRIIEMVD